MNRFCYFISGVLSTAIVLVALTRISDAGQADSIVRLQQSTPGTQQIGHANISGTMKAGVFNGSGSGLTAVPWASISGAPTTLLALPYSSSTGSASTLFSVNNTSTGGGLFGQGTGTGFSGGYGVTGVYTAESPSIPTGMRAGVLGSTNTGDGVIGVTGYYAGVGVYGANVASAGNSYGVYGTSSSPLGYGVYGVNDSHGTASVGVYGRSNGTSGKGVYGEENSASGYTRGVYGSVFSDQGVGVEGFANHTSGNTYGGYFDAASTNGVGVFATSWGTGLYARTLATTGDAGYFENTGLGGAYQVELSGPNGAMDTSGFLYREYTSTTRSAAIPIAYGNIASTGGINSGSGNFTVAHTVAGEYEISINNETYNNTDFSVSATVNVNGTPYLATASNGGGTLRINVWNLVTNAKADFSFDFLVFKSNPGAAGDDGVFGSDGSRNERALPIYRNPKRKSITSQGELIHP